MKLFLSLAFLAPLASGQICEPAGDINTAATALGALSNPQGVLDGDVLYYQAYTLDAGAELWRSDGTPAGTSLLLDIRPGPEGSKPSNMRMLGDKLLFFASDGVNGTEPWVSDGTTAGTMLLRDINAGSDGSFYFGGFTLMGGKAYFTARDQASGIELWSTDGTTAGTRPVIDLWPGPAHSYPTFITADPTDSYLLFRAESQQAGYELHISDGTAAGTRMLADLHTGSGSSYPGSFRTLDHRMVFTADLPTSGTELWITDGTPGGTLPLKDIHPGTMDSTPRLDEAALLNGELYFAAQAPNVGEELWKTDGSPAGTVLVADLASSTLSSSPRELTAFGGDLFFQANINFNRELMRLDGTTGVVEELMQNATYPNRPSQLKASGGQLFFRALGPGIGEELYVTDGTEAGTQLVLDIKPGSTTSYPSHLHAPSSGGIYLIADDPTAGRELMRSDGTAAGTFTILDAQPGQRTSSSEPEELTVIAGKQLYFSADDGVLGRELYRWTKAGGVELIKDIFPGDDFSGPADSDPRDFTLVMVHDKPVVFFSAETDDQGRELWRTEGTTATTYIVKNIATTFVDGVEGELTAAFGKVFFAGGPSPSSVELWSSDGTSSGTQRVAEINPGPQGCDPRELTLLGDKLLFTARDINFDRELYVTDGTEAGTQLLFDVGVGYSSEPSGLTRVGDEVAFLVYRDSQEQGTELWKTDGTAAGTQLVSTIDTAAYAGPKGELVAMGDRLVFNARDNSSEGVWISDLTMAGTQKLFTPIGGTSATELTPVGDRVYFVKGGRLWVVNDDGTGGLELTSALEGAPNVRPSQLTPVNGGVAFVSDFSDALVANELFYSNGTVPGTGLVCDLTPESNPSLSAAPVDSDPNQLRLVDGDLLFVASQPSGVGIELFRSPAVGGYVQDLGLSGSGQQLSSEVALIGGSVTIYGANAPAGTSYLGYGPSLPLPTTTSVVPGNAAWIAPGSAAIAMITQTPSWSYTTTLPPNPALVGLQYTFQSWSVNGGLPATTSNGLQFVIGS